MVPWHPSRVLELVPPYVRTNVTKHDGHHRNHGEDQKEDEEHKQVHGRDKTEDALDARLIGAFWLPLPEECYKQLPEHEALCVIYKIARGEKQKLENQEYESQSRKAVTILKRECVHASARERDRPAGKERASSVGYRTLLHLLTLQV